MSPYESENYHFYICEEWFWKFDEDYIKSVDCFWKYGHFCYTDPTDPRVYNLFPSSDFFFQIMSSVTSIFYPTSFSLTWLELFQVFYVIWSYYKRCCFHNFFLSTLVYMKDTDFCVFFFSSYIAGRIYQLLEFPVKFFNVPYVCYHIVHK